MCACMCVCVCVCIYMRACMHAHVCLSAGVCVGGGDMSVCAYVFTCFIHIRVSVCNFAHAINIQVAALMNIISNNVYLYSCM